MVNRIFLDDNLHLLIQFSLRLGRHKWCQDKQCVMMNEKPTPLEGGWGNWSSWSECTRTCGAGISIQTRECDNPSPANGGSFCTGDRTHYKTCNTEPCPIDEPNFRAVQCSKYDNEKFRGNKYTWLPYFDPRKERFTELGSFNVINHHLILLQRSRVNYSAQTQMTQ